MLSLAWANRPFKFPNMEWRTPYEAKGFVKHRGQLPTTYPFYNPPFSAIMQPEHYSFDQVDKPACAYSTFAASN